MRILEMFFWISSDVQKGMPTTATRVMLCLDECVRVLATRGLELPHHLVLQMDNTTRDHSTAFIVLLLAQLVALGPSREHTRPLS